MSKKEMLFVVGMLAATVAAISALAAFGVTSLAHAEPASQYSVRLTDAGPGGAYTVEFDVRVFDTTGGVPPRMSEWSLRLPAGIDLRREFRTSRFDCDGRALIDAIHRHPSAVPFNARVADLKPFIRQLERSRTKADRAALDVVETCDRARIGGGTGLVDPRRLLDDLGDAIPARFSLFLSRGRSPRAIAGLMAVGAAEEKAQVVRDNPIVGAVHAAIDHDILEDPTPDGRYRYKLLLPNGKMNGLDISITEVDATITGITLRKGTCLREDGRSRCVQRQPRDLFWITRPTCPPSGETSAEVLNGYVPPTPSATTTVPIACPRYTG